MKNSSKLEEKNWSYNFSKFCQIDNTFQQTFANKTETLMVKI